ncbi:MAG: MarR family transcriptional regulator [Chloroflexota bacterium]
MKNVEIEEMMGYLVASVARVHRSLVQSELSKMDLHVGQEMFLLQLWKQDGITLSEMAEGLGVQQATVSRMLNRIEKAGLVTRRKDPADQRVSRVYLTETGHRLYEPITQMWRDLEVSMLDGFTVEERVLLRRFLLQLISNMMK